MEEEQIRAERRIKWVYGFLFVAIITYLFWAMSLIGGAGAIFRSPSPLVQTIGILLPALIFLILLHGLKSPYTYVRRHAQQGLLLAVLVIILVWLDQVVHLIRAEIALLSFLLVWLGGNYRGWRQVNRGDCWLMRKRGEGDLLPRPWAIPKRQHKADLEFIRKLTAEELTIGTQEEEIAQLVERFRYGSAMERKQAEANLEKLGEVDVF